MPVANIADVTNAIITIITQALADTGIWTLTPPPAVFPDPITRNDKEGISYYLYHLQESPHLRNSVPAGRDQPPVKFSPMGLSLYYQLTAIRAENNEGDAAFDEQLWMTIALKALHDNPQVTSLGENNRFRIALQSTPATEAVHNWTAGPSALKLSAYYEVSPVFLEPEKTRLRSGRVLLYGNYVFTGTAPRISASRSTVSFTLPTDLTPRQIEVQPAQAPAGGTITFMGSGFAGGTVQLRLFHPRWSENVLASGWSPQVLTDRITVTVNETANLERNSDPVDVLPGIYAAEVVVIRTIVLPDGTSREIKNTSNRSPFVVMPAFSVTATNGTLITLTGSRFDPTEGVEVYVGENALTLFNGAGDPDRGQLKVEAPDQIKINIPEEARSGEHLPVRVMIAGAESSPLWIFIP